MEITELNHRRLVFSGPVMVHQPIKTSPLHVHVCMHHDMDTQHGHTCTCNGHIVQPYICCVWQCHDAMWPCVHIVTQPHDANAHANTLHSCVMTCHAAVSQCIGSH